MNDLSVEEAARLLRRHPENVRELLRDGRLVGNKVGSERGGTWQIPEANLRRFADPEGEYQAAAVRPSARSTPWSAPMRKPSSAVRFIRTMT